MWVYRNKIKKWGLKCRRVFFCSNVH